MAKHEVFPKKKMNADIAITGLRYVIAPAMTFEVKVDFDNKVYKELKDDSFLIGEMNDKVVAIYKQTCVGIKTKLQAFDKLAITMVDKNAAKADIEKQLDGLNKSIEKDAEIAEQAAEEAVKKVWKDYTGKKKEYLAYKISVVATVVGALAGLLASIGAMATTPFTAGIGTSMSLVGMVKSVVVIVKELHGAWVKVETSVEALSKDVDALEKFAKETAKRKANEYTAMVVNQLLGVAQANIKSCMTQLEAVEAKLVGVEVKTHDAGKALNKIIDLQEEFDTEFMDDAKARLSKHPSPKAKDQLQDIGKELEKEMASSKLAVQAQIEVVEKLYERFTAVDKATEELQKRIVPLAALRSIDEKIVSNILVFADLPLAVWGNNGLVKHSVKASSDLINDVVPWATMLAYERIKNKVLNGTFLDA